MIFTVDNQKPQKLFEAKCPVKMKIQVTGPQVIRFATTSSELNIPGSGALVLDGIQLAQANGIVEWTWVGECWAIAAGPNSQVVILLPGLRESTG